MRQGQQDNDNETSTTRQRQWDNDNKKGQQDNANQLGSTWRVYLIYLQFSIFISLNLKSITSSFKGYLISLWKF